jgi:hypothetical protein
MKKARATSGPFAHIIRTGGENCIIDWPSQAGILQSRVVHFSMRPFVFGSTTMIQRLAVGLALLLLASPVFGQRDPGNYTEPTLPSMRDLDRMNLTMAWKYSVPVDGRSDGIATFQIMRKPHEPTEEEKLDAEKKKEPLIPRYEPYENEIFVQTRSGTLLLLRESNGETIWTWTPPRRNAPVVGVAANFTTVCVMNLSKLYLLDRKDGKVRQSLELPSTPTTGLACDVQQCFVTLANNRVVSVGIQNEDLVRGITVKKKPRLPETPPPISVGAQATSVLETTSNRSPSTTLLKNLRPPFEMSGRDVTPSMIMLKTMTKPYELPDGNAAPSTAFVPSLHQIGVLNEISSADHPRIQWELQTNRRMEDPPHIQGEVLVYSRVGHASFGQGTIQGGIYKESDDAGSVIVVPKYSERQNRIKHQYLSESALTAPVGHYGQELYFCLSDGSVLWVSLLNFENSSVPVAHLERYLAGGIIDRRPIATDDSLYIAGSQIGMTRLERFVGRGPNTTEMTWHFKKIWTNPDAVRVFAVSPRAVYAEDKRGNLLVLEKARGLKLASIPVSGFHFPIVNQVDDRIFLAAANGTVVCLHDKSYRRPEFQKKLLPAGADPLLEAQKLGLLTEPKKEEPKKEEPKKEEPKKEEPKKEEPKKEESKKE